MDNEALGIAPKRARKLTNQDIQAIADCVATMKLTETEACLHLGIKPHQWKVWKSRGKHSATFETIIARTRANDIAGLVNKIRRAGDDQEIELPNGRIANKRGDWRAPAWILERVAPQFAPVNNANAAPAVTVQIGIIHEQLKRVIGFDSQPAIEERRIKMPIRKTTQKPNELND